MVDLDRLRAEAEQRAALPPDAAEKTPHGVGRAARRAHERGVKRQARKVRRREGRMNG